MKSESKHVYEITNSAIADREKLVRDIERKKTDMERIDKRILKNIKSLYKDIPFDDFQRAMPLYNTNEEFDYTNESCYKFIKEKFFSKKDEVKILHIYKIGNDRYVFIMVLSDVKFSLVIPIYPVMDIKNLERCHYGKIQLHKKNQYSSITDVICEDYDMSVIKAAIKKLIKNSNKKIHITKKAIAEFKKQVSSPELTDDEVEKILQESYGDIPLAVNIYKRIHK